MGADCVSQLEGNYDFDSMCKPMRTNAMVGLQVSKVTKYMSVQARGDKHLKEETTKRHGLLK